MDSTTLEVCFVRLLVLLFIGTIGCVACEGFSFTKKEKKSTAAYGQMKSAKD